MTLNDLLSGGPTTWIIIAVVAFFLLRGGAGGNIVDSLLDGLRGILNRPKPKTRNFDDPHDCVDCVVELAQHLDKHKHHDVAKLLRDTLPKLLESHREEQ